MTDRNPTEDCTDERCPFVDYPHSVELVPNTDVRIHFSVDPQERLIKLLWIHGANDDWPDEATMAVIRSTVALDQISGTPWNEREGGTEP